MDPWIVVRLILALCYGHILAFCSLTEIQGCGLRYRTDSHVPTISHGYVSRPSDYPWHVAIYTQMNSTGPPQYICGGSVIHHKLILTAAHCVYDEDTYDISNATFTVITGKYNSSWDYHDSLEKRFKVIDIKIPVAYKGYIQRYAHDIAVLYLNETIKFSSVVIPICISWDSEIKVKESSDVRIVGWGFTENGTLSNALLTTQLKYFNYTTCSNKFKHDKFSQYVTDDKFCAGLDNGTSLELGDSGGGVIISKNTSNNEQQHYIIGLSSTKDSITKISTFTDINKLRPWIKETVLSFIEEGYCMPLASKSVELTQCKFNNTEVDCNKPAMPGTKAKLQCKNSFHAEFPYPLYTEIECQKNLTWSPLMDSCLECGKRYRFIDPAPKIKKKKRKVSEFPWHVAVYSKVNGNILYSCGGTIIHPKIILIAAQCVFHNGPDKISNPKEMFVIAGKYRVNWSIRAPYEQRFQVIGIRVHNSYINRFEGGDIATLELNDTVKTSSYIMPACIDWSNKLKLLEKPYVSGLIAGWGNTELGNPSDELRSTEVLMINRKSCNQRLTYPSILADKWCIISEDGSWISYGDVGGILFPKYDEERGGQTYYIYGVLSVSIGNDTVGVTDVLYYEYWIKNIF